MANLPNIVFAEGDARIIFEKLQAFYGAVRRAELEPSYKDGDDLSIYPIQLTEAAALAQINTDIDTTAKGNLLAFAGNETIEALGSLYGARGERLQPSTAKTTIRYTLSVSRSSVTTIPIGFRTTPDNKIFFATIKTLEIPAGELSGDVQAECLTPGSTGNGFEVGEIRFIVDRSPFIASAVNITPSAGGAEVEELEQYRSRIQLLPESFSVAGPDGAYEFWAKTANADIIDVAVWSPAPVEVNIVPLMRGGAIPTEDILSAVYEVLSDKKRRPLTDKLHILEPEQIEYSIDIQYWIGRDNSVNVTTIQEAVHKAVLEYEAWQSSKLGRDINPSVLQRLIMDAGAKRVVISSPTFSPLEQFQVGKLNGCTLTYGGLENA